MLHALFYRQITYGCSILYVLYCRVSDRSCENRYQHYLKASVHKGLYLLWLDYYRCWCCCVSATDSVVFECNGPEAAWSRLQSSLSTVAGIAQTHCCQRHRKPVSCQLRPFAVITPQFYWQCRHQHHCHHDTVSDHSVAVSVSQWHRVKVSQCHDTMTQCHCDTGITTLWCCDTLTLCQGATMPWHHVTVSECHSVAHCCSVVVSVSQWHGVTETLCYCVMVSQCHDTMTVAVVVSVVVSAV